MTEIIRVLGLPFLACVVMLAILSYIGIHVLKREVIFIDIALAQIAAVGAIAGQVVFHFHDQPVQAYALSLGATLCAAVFFAVVRRRIVEIPLEAVIGVSYAVSAAAALFLVGVAPGGHVHVQEMLAGSILWATWSNFIWSVVVFAVVGFVFFLFRRPFRAISDDYDAAVADGYNTLLWDFLFYALVGVVITTAVRTAGVVVVFTFLIIPATLSAAFASGWVTRLAIAWVVGALSAALGLLFAVRFDFSVGPAIGLYLGVGLITVGLLRAVRASKIVTVAGAVVAAGVFGVWLATGTPSTGSSSGRAPRETVRSSSGNVRGHSHAGAHSHSEDHHLHEATHDAGSKHHELNERSLASVSDVPELFRLYEKGTDAEEKSLVVARLLDVDSKAGVEKALDFLGGDPPLLFRLTVIDKLEEIMGTPVDYQIDESFNSQVNQRAVADLRKTAGLD